MRFCDLRFWILRNCGIAGGFESLKRKGTLLLAKAKSSKSFYALRARFWDFHTLRMRFCVAESRADFALDSAQIVEFAVDSADSQKFSQVRNRIPKAQIARTKRLKPPKATF